MKECCTGSLFPGISDLQTLILRAEHSLLFIFIWCNISRIPSCLCYSKDRISCSNHIIALGMCIQLDIHCKPHVFCIVTIFGRTYFLFSNLPFLFVHRYYVHRYMHVSLLKPTSKCNQLPLFSWLLAARDCKPVIRTTLPWHTNERVSYLCHVVP